MSQEVSKGLVSELQPQYTPCISRRNNPLILTIDPNFQRDIQVGLLESKSERNLPAYTSSGDLKMFV